MWFAAGRVGERERRWFSLTSISTAQMRVVLGSPLWLHLISAQFSWPHCEAANHKLILRVVLEDTCANALCQAGPGTRASERAASLESAVMLSMVLSAILNLNSMSSRQDEVMSS